MANEKVLNTRIQLKYDTLTAWQESAFNGTDSTKWLKSGEVAIVTLAPNREVEPTATAGQHPLLFKVGTGAHKFDDLPWASALAADVYSWAKQSLEEFTAWVAKTPKTVTLKVNNVDTDYTIEEAIKLVRNEITAGGEAAAITIADESAAGKIKYTAKQGGTDIVESIEINEGTGIKINVDNNVPKISHQDKPTTGTAVSSTAGTGRTYVTEVLVDSLGHIAGVKTATETDQEIPDSPAISITDKTQTDNDYTTYVVADLQESGTLNHTITPTYKAVPTKQYVDDEIAAKVAGAVQYLGTVSALSSLSQIAGKGDFYRVAVEIKSGNTVLAHAGDLVVAEKDNPAQQIDNTNWSVIHGEEGDITEVVAGDGLTGGGSTGSVTVGLNQDSKDALALAKTALQSHQDVTGKADKVSGATQGNFAGLDSNGNLVDSGKNATDFATRDEVSKLTTDNISVGEMVWIFNCGGAFDNVVNYNMTTKTPSVSEGSNGVFEIDGSATDLTGVSINGEDLAENFYTVQ